MQSDGSPWRPLAHVEDISRAVPRRARGARRRHPQRGLQHRPRRGQPPDPRHRADDRGDRPRRHASPSPPAPAPTSAPTASTSPSPGALFTPSWTVQRGIEEILAAYTAHHLRSSSSSPRASSASRACASWWRPASSTPSCAGACPHERPRHAARADAGGDPLRRQGHPPARGDRARPQAAGRHRRAPDPVAHHEDLRPLRGQPLRALPRLQELADQGVLPPLPRAARRLHPAPRRPARRRCSTSNGYEDWEVTLPRPASRPAPARA